MPSVYVTIERKITRTIRVDDAKNLDAARLEIERYGALQAFSDYPEAHVEEVVKIRRVAYPHPTERLA